MPIIKPQGLKGLQGIGSLSQKDYDAFIRSLNKVLINQFGLTDLAEDNRVSPDGLDGKREAIITENGR